MSDTVAMAKNEPEIPSTATRRFLPLLLAGVIIIVGVVLILQWRSVPDDSGPDPHSARPLTSLNPVFVPAEFDPQDILLVGGSQLAELHPGVLAAIVQAAAEDIQITILSGSPAGTALIDSVLDKNSRGTGTVEIIELPIRSMWVRDFGPVTVRDGAGRRTLVDFKYRERRGNALDDSVPGHLARELGIGLETNPLLVEGGDFLGNGRGLCLMSTRVINRNAHYLEKEPQQTVEEFAVALGFENISLAHPLQGESTGHLDMFSVFLRPDLVLIGSYDPLIDPENAARLDELAARLNGFKTLEGPLQVERIPLPDHADDVWRTYTNVVFANGVLLVPIYPSYCPELDQVALDLYRRLMPDWKVVGIDASELIKMRGALRCITLNIPQNTPLYSN